MRFRIPDSGARWGLADLLRFRVVPRYIMLSTLGPNGAATLSEAPERLKEVNEEVEALGVRVLDQYALLGQYDFLNIVEAPDDVTMTKLAIALASRGTMKTVTLPAVPVDDFIARLRGD